MKRPRIGHSGGERPFLVKNDLQIRSWNMIESQSSDSLEGIAIIGMAGRFPGAKNTDDLWRNLCEGVESITFFTDKELDP
ncbi:hypothetical protein KA005_60020, partial [bacterium]|nr:hypothetical protein [bacterium]